MKIAIIGSRGIKNAPIDHHVSVGDEIVSGGAEGVDTCAAKYAREKGIKLTVFLPEYSLYGRGAPLVRNRKIVEYADKVIAFWDGKSKGTLFTINYAKKIKKECLIILCE